jgi:hypothetical protein
MGKRTDEAATESSPVGGRQLRRFSAVTIAHDRALSGASGQLYLTQREGAGPATRVGRAGATHDIRPILPPTPIIDSPSSQMPPTSPGASVPAVGTNILIVPNKPQRDRRVRDDVLR